MPVFSIKPLLITVTLFDFERFMVA